LIRDVANNIATHLLSENDWLDSVRTAGFQKRIAVEDGRDRFVVYDGDNEIGLTDIAGNSGYIRYRSSIRYSELKRLVSSQPAESLVTVPMRVVVLLEHNYPEDIAFAIASQLQRYHPTVNSLPVSITIQNANGNTDDVCLEETGTPMFNSEKKIISVDFEASFKWSSNCELPVNYPAMCNCTNTLNLGCFGSCDLINTGIAQNGIVTMQAFYAGIMKQVNIPDDDPSGIIVVNASWLNENYTTIVKFVDSDGEYITYEVDGVIYDCFQIKTIPSNDPSE